MCEQTECSNALSSDWITEQGGSRQIFNQQVFDQERALYGLVNASIMQCVFDGPADGESAIKECQDLHVDDCDFRLRYPFWHVQRAQILNSRMTDTCRAALWYCKQIQIQNSQLGGIKAVRECRDLVIDHCNITSDEFGWLTHEMTMRHTQLTSEYPCLFCTGLVLDHFKLEGKYAFQYVQNAQITDSELHTKDAFWHSRNVTITDSLVQGEYLGWYSENLKLVRCKIVGTQPLCYARGLVLEDCQMIDCDLAFERSDVQATIKGNVTSIKNPSSGKIVADSIGQVILDDELHDDQACIIKTRK